MENAVCAGTAQTNVDPEFEARRQKVDKAAEKIADSVDGCNLTMDEFRWACDEASRKFVVVRKRPEERGEK